MKKIYNKVILSSFLLMGFLSGCGSVANGTKTYSYEYDYKEVEGGLEITGIRYNKKNKVLDITIPNEIRDKKVISIAPNALKDVDIIRHVIMGANIQNIGQEALIIVDEDIEQKSSNSQAVVRFINLSPDLPIADIFNNDKPIVDNIDYKDQTIYEYLKRQFKEMSAYF